MKNILLLLALSLNCVFIFSQNTIGYLNNGSGSYNGYTLISTRTNTLPNSSYLINNCGNIINQWESNYSLAKADYILKNGNILRITSSNNSSTIVLPGKAGRAEIRDWDNTLIWEFDLSNDQEVLHHDVFPMDNGNILIMIAKRHTDTEAHQAGRNPALLTDVNLLEEYIIEVEPTGLNTYNLIWQWNSWDHLVQDFDNSKDNFGVVADNPQLLDINHIKLNPGAEDWLHYNAMFYNEDLDQILISSRNTGEFYIIDHSTSTSDAAGHTGGNSGKGGDYIYRWGNPEAYDQGISTDQKAFGQHSVHWIPQGLPDAGKIMFFNNGAGRGHSSVDIITPPYNAITKNYDYTPGTSYGPSVLDYTYVDPTTPTDFYARFVSNAQMQPNGNILINHGPSGYLFEIDPSTNTKVWEYINPIDQTVGIIPQGGTPSDFTKVLFRVKKYPTDYIGFTGKDLTPGNNIEQNNESCTILSINDYNFDANLTVYPIPSSDIINIKSDKKINNIQLYDINGKLIFNKQSKILNIEKLDKGVYILRIHLKNTIKNIRVVKN